MDNPKTQATLCTRHRPKTNKTDRQQHHRLNPFARKGKAVPIYCKIPAV
jgi:hypothetical protein